MIRLAWQGLWERKARTLLALVGLAVCVLALTTVDGMLGFIQAENQQDEGRFADRLLLQPPGAGYPPFKSVIHEESLTPVFDLPGIIVEESTPLLFIVLEPPDNPMDVAGVIGLGILPGREQAWLANTAVVAGKSTLLGENLNAVILGNEAARFYDVTAPGQTIEIADQQWQVVGLLNETGLSNVDNLVLMPLRTAQEVFTQGEWISSILLTSTEEHIHGLVSQLSQAYPGLEVNTQEDIHQFLANSQELPNKFLGTISWAAFFITILIIANIMSIAVRERTQEVERLQRIGEKKSEIIKYSITETLLLSLSGGLIGMLAAIPIAYFLDWLWILTWQEMVRILALVLSAGFLSSTYPALRASSVYPKAIQFKKLREQVEEISADKRAMDQAYRQLVYVREEERERLSRELHDQAIQSLVGLKFHMKDKNIEPQGELQTEIDEVIETLRDLCSDLRPPALENLGLVPVLQSYLNDFENRTGLPVKFKIEGKEQRLPTEIELSLFRVVQEAMTNAWRHAQTPKMDVILRFDNGVVNLTVSDQGCGFIVPERLKILAEKGHFGLVNMDERVEHMGGSLQLSSEPEQGTTITATIPIHSDK
jgi:signal transduction histidine kinase